MKLKINVIDAFTNVAFKGNSAAVIITDDWLDDALMQNIASENNLSETAFVKRISADNFHIRWFSPLSEIDFCGHATLASAFVIFEQSAELEHITFYAKAVGNLTVSKQGNGDIEMSFPKRAPVAIAEIPSALLEGLSIAPQAVLLSEQAYFAIYANEAQVQNVQQNPALIKQLAPYDVVVSAPANTGSDYDFVSRYFWPANGGDEDPVTGSIHAGLVPYWAKILNKNQLMAYQASQRGGVLNCRLNGDRVYICGQAVQYLSGTIEV